MAATDVGDLRTGPELGLDTRQRGDPGVDQIGLVPGSEEPVGAAEQALGMIPPRPPLAGLEGFGCLFMPANCDTISWKKPCMQAGWPSRVKTSACSGVIENVSSSA